MRAFLAVVCCVTSLITASNGVLAQQEGSEPPAADMLDAIRTLTAMKLSEGRLRIDEQRWHEASYPSAQGNQHEQLLADTESHGMSLEEARGGGLEWQSDRVLSLYSANKLLSRIVSAAKPHSFGGGLGGGATMDFSTSKVSAAFSVAADPYARVTMSQHSPEVRELTIDDNPERLFRLACRRSDRVGLLAQNLAGRIHLVFDTGDAPAAMVWKDYRSMLADKASLPPLLRSDLAKFAVTFPDADSESRIRVPPSNLQQGPLPQVRFVMSHLARLHLADGRLALDRQHWNQAVEDLASRPSQPRAGDDPFGNDPFGRAAIARHRTQRNETPLDKLIQRFGDAIQSSGRSASGNKGIRIAREQSESLLARFLSDINTQRIKMSFVESTRHARLLTIEETPGESFTLLFSDPDYTLLLVQGSGGQVRFAYCDTLESAAAFYASYGDLVKSDNPGLALLTRLLEAVGVTLPS